MILDMIAHIKEHDPEVGAVIEREYKRQQDCIELIASENFVSEASMLAAGSVLTNKYAEGYPGKRFYGGCHEVDVVENIAIERAKKVFGAKFANVQPHSGAQANYVAYMVLTSPGDTILGMNLDHGGHLTHGSPANYSGKYHNIVSYGVRDDTQMIDYDEVLKIAKQCKPKMIIAGASAYPRLIDFKKFSEIAKEVGASLMVDIAHLSGLVAAGEHPDPVPYADIVSSTTHKTLRGTRGGLLLTNREDLAKKINAAVFPGTQGGPLMHVIASKAVALGEALKPGFKEYQQKIRSNAKALAEALMNRGFDLVSGGTDNHLMLIDLRKWGVTGLDLQVNLDSVNVTTNRNKIPNDPQPASVTSGLRVGTPAVTTRGFGKAEMDIIAELIYRAVTDFDANASFIRNEAGKLCKQYPLYE